MQDSILPSTIPSMLDSTAVAVLEYTILVSDLIVAYSALNTDVSKEFKDITKIGMYRCQKSDLVQFYPVVCGSENMYHQLQKHQWYYLEDKNEYRIASRYIKKNDFVLEVGCGRGSFRNKIPESAYAGLEFNAEALQYCKNISLDVSSETIEEYSKKYANHYDVVCSFQVLEHVSDVYSFLQGMLQCVKPGGLVIFSVPSDDSFSRIVPRYALNLPPHHITRWSDNAIYYLKNVLNVELVELCSDTLQSVHFEFYIRSMANYMACCDLNIPHISMSPEKFLQIQINSNKFISAIQKKVQKEYSTIRGHDVTAIFRKKS